MANNETDISPNQRLLVAAIKSAKASDIKALINAGADVNCRNKDGLTPLKLSDLYNSNYVVTKALIDAGADVSAREPRFKSTSLHLAASNSRNPKIIDVLVAGGADLNDKNYLGETPLIMAMRNQEARIASHLIEIGADVNASDYNGKTVLYHAEINKRNYLAKQVKEKS